MEKVGGEGTSKDAAVTSSEGQETTRLEHLQEPGSEGESEEGIVQTRHGVAPCDELAALVVSPSPSEMHD